jgi:hypothetical protein
VQTSFQRDVYATAHFSSQGSRGAKAWFKEESKQQDRKHSFLQFAGVKVGT